jgi:hypothetical protein
LTSSESGNSSSEPAALASESAPGAQGSSDPNRDAQVIEVRVDLSQSPRPEPEHSPEGMARAIATQAATPPAVPAVESAQGSVDALKPEGEPS